MNPIDPLLPLVCVTAYFVGALALFELRTRRGLRLDDPEVSLRPASLLLGRYLRHYMMWVLSPYERALVRLGVSPNALTLSSLATAVGAGLCLSRGRFGAGGWLYLLTGMLDILDGRVARRTGHVTMSGAYLDSVIDRYAELVVFAGLGYYYRASWVLGVVMMACVGSLMVSYARARGEALGADVKMGTMQRPERMLYLGAVLAHSPLWQAIAPLRPGPATYPPAVAALLLLGLSTNVTAIRRIVRSMRDLDRLEAGRAPVELPAAAVADSATPPALPEVGAQGTDRRAAAVEQRLARLRPVG